MLVILEIEARGFKASLGYIEHFKARLGYTIDYLKKQTNKRVALGMQLYGLAGIY